MAAAPGLERRSPMDLAGEVIRTPQALADRIRALQEHAHVLSPTVAVSAIPDHYAINTAVVPIDPRVGPDGAGPDVYFQRAIHKSHNAGTRQDPEWVPDEVSLGKNGLLRILAAAGVKMTRSERTDDNSQMFYWTWCTEGTITDFDGGVRPLPPGDVEIDLRDGSPQIGGWTPAEWDKRVAAAEERKAKLPDKEQWKAKPEAIDGWTKDRVMSARRFGLRLAQAKSLTAFARNLGIKSKYTVKELEKPFVLFRATFMPNMNNPRVEEMVTAAHLGSTSLLYGGTTAPALPAAGDGVIDAERVEEPGAPAKEPLTDAAPENATEIDDIPAPKAQEPPEADAYRIAKVSQLRDRYFFETLVSVDGSAGPTFTTENVDIARSLNGARREKHLIQLSAEPVELNGRKYLEVVESRVLAPRDVDGRLPGLDKV